MFVLIWTKFKENLSIGFVLIYLTQTSLNTENAGQTHPHGNRDLKQEEAVKKMAAVNKKIAIQVELRLTEL